MKIDGVTIPEILAMPLKRVEHFKKLKLTETEESF